MRWPCPMAIRGMTTESHVDESLSVHGSRSLVCKGGGWRDEASVTVC
jgi:hypothetical protein